MHPVCSVGARERVRSPRASPDGDHWTMWGRVPDSCLASLPHALIPSCQRCFDLPMRAFARPASSRSPGVNRESSRESSIRMGPTPIYTLSLPTPVPFFYHLLISRRLSSQTESSEREAVLPRGKAPLLIWEIANGANTQAVVQRVVKEGSRSSQEQLQKRSCCVQDMATGANAWLTCNRHFLI